MKGRGAKNLHGKYLTVDFVIQLNRVINVQIVSTASRQFHN